MFGCIIRVVTIETAGAVSAFVFMQVGLEEPMICKDLSSSEGCWIAVGVGFGDECLGPLSCGGMFIPFFVP